MPRAMTARDDTPPQGSICRDCSFSPRISLGNHSESWAGVSGTRSRPPVTVAARAVAASRAACAAARESLRALALPASRAASSRLRSACWIFSMGTSTRSSPWRKAGPSAPTMAGTASGGTMLSQTRSARGRSSMLVSRKSTTTMPLRMRPPRGDTFSNAGMPPSSR